MKIIKAYFSSDAIKAIFIFEDRSRLYWHEDRALSAFRVSHGSIGFVGLDHPATLAVQNYDGSAQEFAFGHTDNSEWARAWERASECERRAM